MSQPNSPRYVTCPCQHCSGKIEFDANQLDVSGAAGNTLTGQTIACPHCRVETMLFIPPAVAPPDLKPKTTPATPPNLSRKQKWQFNTLHLFFLGIVVLATLLAIDHVQLLHQNARLAAVLAELQNEKAQSVRATEDANIKQLVAQGKAALSGIYVCDNPLLSRNQFDLRSDDSAIWFVKSGGDEIRAGDAKWTTDGDSVKVGLVAFKIEGSDLIDGKGNRWLHIR